MSKGPASGMPASGMPASGIPARGRGTQPPFAKGHQLAVTSGHRAPRVYGALAEQLAAGLVADRPDLLHYPEAVSGWASVEAQAALLRRHLARVGTIDPKTGEPRPGPLRWLLVYERQAAAQRMLLGLDPRSEASLARDRAEAATLAVDLEALAERGRASLAAREAAGEPRPADLAGEVLAEARAVARDEYRRSGSPATNREAASSS